MDQDNERHNLIIRGFSAQGKQIAMVTRRCDQPLMTAESILRNIRSGTWPWNAGIVRVTVDLAITPSLWPR